MTGLENVTPLILAGGLGSRLKSIISDRPKVLVDVLGQPFISYILTQLNNLGTEYVVLSTGYLGDMIREEYGDKYKNLRIIYSEEHKPLGTGGAIRLALPLIKTPLVMVMNGDSYINISLNDYINWFTENNLHASICLTKKNDTKRFGRVKLKKNGIIDKFIEKKDFSGPGLINAGIYIFEKKLLNNIPTNKFYSLEREFFPRMLKSNIHGYLCNNAFIDIGTTESYDKANKFFKSNIINCE